MTFDAIALTDLPDEIQLNFDVITVFIFLFELIFKLCLPDYLLIFDDLPLEVVLITLVTLLQLLDMLLLQHHPDLALDLTHEVLLRVSGAISGALFGLGMGFELDCW